MNGRTALAIIGLAVAVALPVTTATAAVHLASGLSAASSVLAQDEQGHAALDNPHPAGVTETEYGCPATVASLPTGSPGLLEGDIGETAGPGTAGAGISPDMGYDPTQCSGAPEPH